MGHAPVAHDSAYHPDQERYGFVGFASVYRSEVWGTWAGDDLNGVPDEFLPLVTHRCGSDTRGKAVGPDTGDPVSLPEPTLVHGHQDSKEQMEL